MNAWSLNTLVYTLVCLAAFVIQTTFTILVGEFILVQPSRSHGNLLSFAFFLAMSAILTSTSHWNTSFSRTEWQNMLQCVKACHTAAYDILRVLARLWWRGKQLSPEFHFVSRNAITVQAVYFLSMTHLSSQIECKWLMEPTKAFQ